MPITSTVYLVANSALSCGMCTDSAIAHFLPFLPYWLIIFTVWNLLIGNAIVSGINEEKGVEIQYPIRFFGLFALISIGLSFFTGGSILLPFAILLPVWMVRIIKPAIKHRFRIWQNSLRYLIISLLVSGVASYFAPLAFIENYYRSM